MKALLAVSETDPQGEVIGVDGVIELPESFSEKFFTIWVADSGMMLGFVYEIDKNIRKLAHALCRDMEGSR